MNCFVTPNNTLLNTAQLAFRERLADEILLLIAISLIRILKQAVGYAYLNVLLLHIFKALQFAKEI